MAQREVSRLTAFGYIVDFLTIPTVAAICLYLFPPATLFAFWCVLLGYLVWTLVEYVIHRHIFHRLYRRDHWVHHLRPDDTTVGVSPVVSNLALLGAGVGLVLAGAAIATVANGVQLWAGLLIGYCSYIFTHHAIHHGWIKSGCVKARHDIHHSGVEANFNVLFPLWDIVLGTYRA